MLRPILKAPGFSATVVLTLAVGIGATTAMFSAVYGVLLRPLPFSEPDRLVRLSEGYEGASQLRPGALLSNVTYHAWRDAGLQSIQNLEGYTPASDLVAAEIDGQRELVRIGSVTPGLFSMLGVTPVLGRMFAADDEGEALGPLLIVSERYWRRRFGADAAVLGRTMVVTGTARTIVGVVPASFALPDPDTDVWRLLEVPEPTGPVPNPAFSAFIAVARLRLDATAEQVSAEGTVMARRRDPKPLAARLTFGEGGEAFVQARPMADEMTASVRSALLVVAAGIACILLIACVNAANLLLSRTAVRMRELVVRAALGASRRRLVRDLLAESALLATTAAALGLLLALGALRVASQLAPSDFPRLQDIRLDVPAFAVAAGVALFTAIASALPALSQLGQVNAAAAFTRGYSSRPGLHPGGHRIRRALIAAEVSFAVVVLIAALLLARTFVELTRVDAGYSAEGVLIADIYRPNASRETTLRLGPLMTLAVDRIRALPGVEAAALGMPTPLDVNSSLAAFPIPSAPRTPEQVLAGVRAAGVPTALARFYTVTPGLDRALGLRLRAGRFLEPSDGDGDIVRWVVNEEFARLYLPPDPVGRRFPWQRGGKPAQLEIVGIVGNVLKDGNAESPAAEVYGIWRDTDGFFIPSLVVRSAAGAPDQAAAVRAILREVAPDVVVSMTPLADRLSASLALPRLAAALFSAIALMAVALTALGVLAALSYGLAQRAREFGVRVAVGATRRQLVTLVVRDGVLPAAAGVLLGLAASTALTRGLRSVLFGISPLDTTSFVVAPAVLIPITIVACLLPAIRASRVDPVTVLKAE